MSGTLRNYSAVVAEQDGVRFVFGSMGDPIGEASVGGDHISGPERLSIEPEDYIVLWQQSHNKLRFQQLGFRVIGDGTATVFWRTDLPTSSSNFTPLGTRQRWHNKAWPCKQAPFWFCDQTQYSISNLANEVADNGSGLPYLLATSFAADAQETVIIDKVLVYNMSEDDPLIIERLLVQ